MSEIAAIRRNNLQKLVDSRFAGNASALGKFCTMSPSQVYNLLLNPKSSNSRNVGEKLARKIEAALGLPERWMDVSESALAPTNLTSEEDLFLMNVRKVVKGKAVPAHIMQTVLYLLSVAPDKT